MPSTKDIRRRIKSVKSTSQITKAMELIAATKMRKAQAQAIGTRTYARLAWELSQNLSEKTDPRIHRLLKRPEKTRRIAIVIITSNRGLIGSFNNALVAAALDYAKNKSEVESIHFIPVGKKGLQALHKKGHTIAAIFEKADVAYSTLDILPLAKLITDDFVSGKYDKVVLVYMDFISTLSQKPRVQDLLPLSAKPIPGLGNVGPMEGLDIEDMEREEIEPSLHYLYEPDADAVMGTLLPRLVEMQIYQALLETNASEHSARMVAMKNATDAAKDLVVELTLEYNRMRQEAITTEISEIVAGQLAINN